MHFKHFAALTGARCLEFCCDGSRSAIHSTDSDVEATWTAAQTRHNKRCCKGDGINSNFLSQQVGKYDSFIQAGYSYAVCVAAVNATLLPAVQHQTSPNLALYLLGCLHVATA